MISLSPRQKERIRQLVKSAREHSKNANLIAKASKAILQRHECYVCGENIKDGYRINEGTICKECYGNKWKRTVCELCHKEFESGYMARKPDGQFALMCSECFDKVYKEEVTDD